MLARSIIIGYFFQFTISMSSLVVTANIYLFQEAKTFKAELDKCRNLIEEMKKTSTQKQTLFHRMQKKLLLVSRERDSYRQQLDSYEKDLTMNINTSSANSGNNQLQSQRERIEALEKIVDSYRELNAKLEVDLQNASIYAGMYTYFNYIKNETNYIRSCS